MAIKRMDETQEQFQTRQAEEGQTPEYSLPNRVEDENYTLSLALYYPGTGEELAAKLTPEHYLNAQNRLVFNAIQALIESGQLITLNNVYQFLLDKAEGDPFSVVTPFELSARYERQHFGDTRGLSDAIERLNASKNLRLIIHHSTRAMARAHKGERPEEIIGEFQDAERQISRANVTAIDSVQASEEAAQVYDKLNRGEIVCLPSGLPEFDSLLYGGGFWGGDNVLIAGETSTGKTTFALNLLINLCSAGFRGLLFSLEMRRFKVISRLHSNLARVPNWKIRPHMDERSGQGIVERLKATLDRVSRLPFKIDDTTKRVDDIARVSRYEVKNNGVDFVMVDYLGLCLPPRGFRGGSFERATEISHILTETSHDLGVPFFNVCQLRRLTKDDMDRNKQRGRDVNEPHLDMLKNSGDIENDADTAIMLWRNKEDVKEGERNQLVDAWGKLAKQRQGELGRFKLLFAPDIYYFTTPKLLEAERKNVSGETTNF